MDPQQASDGPTEGELLLEVRVLLDGFKLRVEYWDALVLTDSTEIPFKDNVGDTIEDAVRRAQELAVQQIVKVI